MSITNGILTVSVDSNCLITVVDSRSSQTWSQYNTAAKARANLVEGSDYIQFELQQDGHTITCVLTLIDNKIEVTLDGSGSLTDWSFSFPNGFLSPNGYSIVAPMNEGQIVPVNDITALNTNFIGYYSSWATSLPMYGVCDGTHGYMVYVNTPFDAGASLSTLSSGNVVPRMVWRPEKGLIGYQRKITYYFYATDGNHVQMAKDLRSIFDGDGTAVTLASKASVNSNVNKIIAAYEVWWGGLTFSPWNNPAALSNQLVAAGIAKAALAFDSYGYDADNTTVRANNQLASKYFIYQDSWSPVDWPVSGMSHRGGYNPGTSTWSGYGIRKTSGYSGPSDPTNRIHWPSGYSAGTSSLGTCTASIANPCVITKTGHGLLEQREVQFSTTGLLPGGLVAGTSYYVKYVDADHFQLYYAIGAGVVNTSGSQSGVHTLLAVKRSFPVCRAFTRDDVNTDTLNEQMRSLVPTVVSGGHYDGFFIDTDTASDLTECYDPNHPTTRRTDMTARQDIMQFHVDSGFVVGGEQGTWWSVPYLTWGDGMFELTSWYGSWSGKAYNETPPANYTTYQTGYGSRIPLWELTFHDCFVSYNRWDDRFEQFVSERTRKKLWFMLYGLMPLSRPSNTYGWNTTGTDWIAAAKAIYDVSSTVAGCQMTNHEFLNPSKSQQRTTWSNGVTVTVDFDAGTFSTTGTSSSSSSSRSSSSSSQSESSISTSSSSSSNSSSSSSNSSYSTSSSSMSTSSSSTSTSSSSSSPTSDRPNYYITTPQDLQNMSLDLSGNYFLQNELDMAGFDWTPVGSYSQPFTGKFDGQNHRISNLALVYRPDITHEPVVWGSEVNVAPNYNGNGPGEIKKTGGVDGVWDAGAFSDNPITGDGTFVFSMGEEPVPSVYDSDDWARSVGLSTSNTGVSWENIQYGLKLDRRNRSYGYYGVYIAIIESGTEVFSTFWGYTTPAVFSCSIQRSGGQIFYFVDGNQQWVSSNYTSDPLYAQASISHMGGTCGSPVFYNGDIPVISLEYIGMFGSTMGAELRNVWLDNMVIDIDPSWGDIQYVGGLVGMVQKKDEGVPI